MHARILGRIVTALPLAAVGCATAAHAGLRYPLEVRSAHVATEDATRPLLITGPTVHDDDLRILLHADQSGFVFTFAAGEGTRGTIVWDEATYARNDGAPRRLSVGRMARRSLIPPDDVGPLIVSGVLFEQDLVPDGSVTAYARPIEFIDFQRSCDEILGTNLRLEIPVASNGAVRRYSLLLKAPWVAGSLVDDELQTLRCGPISRDGSAWDPS